MSGVNVKHFTQSMNYRDHNYNNTIPDDPYFYSTEKDSMSGIEISFHKLVKCINVIEKSC